MGLGWSWEVSKSRVPHVSRCKSSPSGLDHCQNPHLQTSREWRWLRWKQYVVVGPCSRIVISLEGSLNISEHPLYVYVYVLMPTLNYLPSGHEFTTHYSPLDVQAKAVQLLGRNARQTG